MSKCHCGKTGIYRAGELVFCFDHKDGAREEDAGIRREKNAAKVKSLQDHRKLTGICVQCLEPSGMFTKCDFHRNLDAKQHRELYRKRNPTPTKRPLTQAKRRCDRE